MLDEQQREFVRKSTLVMQIITAALVCGVLFFASIVLVVLQADDQPANADEPIITYVAVAFGVMALLLGTVVPHLFGANYRKQLLAGAKPPANMQYPAEAGEIGPLVVTYQFRLILGAAILEGAAFFNLIAHMLEGQMMSLAMAALLVVGILLKFPTRSRVERWVETELRTMEELRSLG